MRAMTLHGFPRFAVLRPIETKATFTRLRCAISLVLIVGFLAHSLSAAEAARKGLPVILTHPRISLTPAVLKIIKAKVAARDPEWLSLKGYADNDLTYTVIPWCESCCASSAICYNYLGSGYLL